MHAPADTSHSQPSRGSPLQSAKPAPHVVEQVPLAHVTVMFGAPSPGQPLPQPLQLRGSFVSLTQPPSQFVVPAPQLATQPPSPWQSNVDAQVTPHRPQFLGSPLNGFVSQPLAATPSQSR